jgi:hypothetical protein
MNYWTVVEPVWNLIDISNEKVFLETYGAAPRTARLLYATHFCQSEVCNGGFHQFFWNSTGVIAPEAVDGFQEIGQRQIASLVLKAMKLFGDDYPRDRAERQTRLTDVSKISLDSLDQMFYALIESEAGGFTAAADLYAAEEGAGKAQG